MIPLCGSPLCGPLDPYDDVNSRLSPSVVKGCHHVANRRNLVWSSRTLASFERRCFDENKDGEILGSREHAKDLDKKVRTCVSQWLTWNLAQMIV